MGMYFEKRGVDSGRSLSLAHECILELCLKNDINSDVFING